MNLRQALRHLPTPPRRPTVPRHPPATPARPLPRLVSVRVSDSAQLHRMTDVKLNDCRTSAESAEWQMLLFENAKREEEKSFSNCSLSCSFHSMSFPTICLDSFFLITGRLPGWLPRPGSGGGGWRPSGGPVLPAATAAGCVHVSHNHDL